MTDQFIGQTLAGKYRVDSKLRESGLGKIYRGTHLLMDKPVSVKILSPALAADENTVKDFSAEARTISRISHPNILNVTDFGTDAGGTVYTILEDANGETLKEAIAREEKFTLNRAVRIAWQIAAALAAAHAAGVVHNHLNAGNVLLAQTPADPETVKILNFGSVESKKDFAPEDKTVLKDLEYLSPEQNTSATESDERSDVYALGVIFYEMLTGEVPFKAENVAALISKQAKNPPPPLTAYRSDLPEDIEFVVLKALAKNPEMRYQTASEFANALNRASNNVGGAQTILAPLAAADVTDNATNNLWKTAFVVLAGISLLAVGLIYATSVKQTNVPTQLQTDANGQPVQPLNPATGTSEQGLANIPYPSAEMAGNANIMIPQIMSGGGGGYDPWARGGAPPAGAPPPMPIGPPGQIYTIPGNSNSIFMQDGVIYERVPVNSNTNTNAQLAPTATPKGGKTPAPAANTVQPSPTPNAQTPAADTKPAPTPAPKTEKTPAKPVATPKTTTPPASTAKRPQSGEEQNL